jgi:hypothetical protein
MNDTLEHARRYTSAEMFTTGEQTRPILPAEDAAA